MKIPPSTIPTLALACLSFPVWQLVFTRPDLPIQVQIAASDAGTVKAYWENPTGNPTAYEEIPVKPVPLPAGEIASNLWRIKVEALAEKEPTAKSAEVWLADVRTPEHQINWAEVNMGAKKWNLINNPYGPQGKLAAAQAGQPQSLEAVVKGSALTITLLRSAWSGKVRVTANRQVREVSLYSANGAVEKLSFEPTELESKKTKTYDISVAKTPWHRLKFISEATATAGIKVKAIRINDQTILPDANGEFVLPFYVWNRFSCAIAATTLSFLSLTIIVTSIAYARRQRPDSLHWQWIAHDRSPRAILKVKIANQEVPVLPYQAIKYFLASLVVLITGLSVAEGYLSNQERNKVIRVQSHQKYQIADLSLLTTSASPLNQQVAWQRAQLGSLEWVQEDNRINQNNAKKNLTSGSRLNPTRGDWIWRSVGFPVGKLAKKPNRILVMGDSFVWGDGYANMNDIWWRQLQRELAQRGYEQVEIIAAGLTGATTWEELEQARKLIQSYKPNLIIWGYVTNDPDEGVIKLFTNYGLINRDPIVSMFNRFQSQGIFPRLSALLSVARSQKAAQVMSGEQYGYDSGQWQQKLLESKNFNLYRKTVQKLGAFQITSGIPGFIMTLPNHPNRDLYGSNYDKVIPLFQAVKIPVYNILDDYTLSGSNLYFLKRLKTQG